MQSFIETEKIQVGQDIRDGGSLRDSTAGLVHPDEWLDYLPEPFRTAQLQGNIFPPKEIFFGAGHSIGGRPYYAKRFVQFGSIHECKASNSFKYLKVILGESRFSKKLTPAFSQQLMIYIFEKIADVQGIYVALWRGSYICKRLVGKVDIAFS
jgi:hypothetical protein